MTKENKKNVNLIPILLLVVVIAAAGFLLLKDSINLPWARKDNTIEVKRLEGFPRNVETEKALKKQRMVIKSKEELKGFLSYLDITDEGTFQAVMSQVDFNQSFLIGVSSDIQEETDGLYRVKRVINNKTEKTLKVMVVHYKPDIGCTPQIKNNVLVDLVSISKTDLIIDFDIIKETKKCD